MQSIGLTIEEIAIIYLALPFTTFLSPPITGKIISAIWYQVAASRDIQTELAKGYGLRSTWSALKPFKLPGQS